MLLTNDTKEILPKTPSWSMEVTGLIGKPVLMYALTTSSKGENAEYIYSAAAVCPVLWPDYFMEYFISQQPDLFVSSVEHTVRGKREGFSLHTDERHVSTTGADPNSRAAAHEKSLHLIQDGSPIGTP